MRSFGWLGCLTLGLLLVAEGAAGQSLGEAARKERERRKKAGPVGPTFTDADLKAGEPGGEPAPAASGEEPAPPGEVGEPAVAPPGDEAGPGTEVYWRERARTVRDRIAAAEDRLRRAETALEGARVGIRQPLPGDALKQVPDSPVTDAERQAAEKEVAAARLERERARKAQEDLEDEARRREAPPGWLR